MSAAAAVDIGRCATKGEHVWPGGHRGFPGAVCERCARVYAGPGRPKKAAVSAQVSPPRTRTEAPAQGQRPPMRHPEPQPIAQAPAPALRPPLVVHNGGRMSAAADRLRQSRGFLRLVPDAVPPSAVPSAVPSASPVAAEAERDSLTAWLLPGVPDLAVEACQIQIERSGRIPNEPDPEWQERFNRNFKRALGGALPELEMHPVLACFIALFFLWLSMRWGAELKTEETTADAEPKKAPAPVKPPPTPPAAPTKQERKDPWQSESDRESPPLAATPKSAPDFPEYQIALGFPDASSPPETSEIDGDAKTADNFA